MAIVVARQSAGLSQAELARRAGISASYLSRIEGAAWTRGGPLPAEGVLRALARTLGISSTALMARRKLLQDERMAAADEESPGGATRRAPYAVSLGPEEVDAAARDLVARNPIRGTLRSAQVFLSARPADARAEPSYLDALGATLAANPDAMLYRVMASDPCSLTTARTTVSQLAGGRPPEQAVNVRTRVAASNPLVIDVLIGDHEVLLAIPDRRGHPHLRAGIVVDDCDFVAAVRGWFDETVWESPGGYVGVRAEAIDDAFLVV